MAGPAQGSGSGGVPSRRSYGGGSPTRGIGLAKRTVSTESGAELASPEAAASPMSPAGPSFFGNSDFASPGSHASAEWPPEGAQGTGGCASPLLPGTLRLDLAATRLSLPKLLELLEALPCERLRELDVSRNELGDAAPKAVLRQLPALRTLRLSRTGMSADGVRAAVGALLRHAERPAPIEPASPASASSSSPGTRRGERPSRGPQHDDAPPGLYSLDLAACSLDPAAQELGAFLASPRCRLTALDISWNQLGPDAVRTLAQRLRGNSTLRSLRLANCHLREEAAVLLASLGSPDCRMPLQKLCLARNGMQEAAFRELGAFLGSAVGRRLAELDVSENAGVGDEPCSKALGQALLAAPEESRDADGAGRLSALQLGLSGSKPFFNPAFGRWDAAPHILTTLRSPSCRVLEVVLDQCGLAEAAMPTLARVCLNVRAFSLCGCPRGEAFVAQLSELARCLVQQRRPAAAAAASGEDLVQSPSLSGTSSVRSAARAAALRLCLRELRLNDSGLQDPSAALLAEVLLWLHGARRDRGGLEVLELAGNHLTAESMAALGPVLAGSQRLRRLVLSRNRLRQAGGARLREWLPLRGMGAGSAAPLELLVRRCCLQPDGVLQLWSGASAEGAAVAHLDIAENSVDDACLEAMLAALPKHSGGPPRPLAAASLLPNPCSPAAMVAFLVHSAPWMSISLQGAGLEAPAIAQLLHCLGSACQQQDAGQTSSLVRSCFSLSLEGASLLSKGWQWGIISDAISYALAPTARKTGGKGQLVKSVGAPWRRLGGCGGALHLKLDSCELSQTTFKAPSSLAPSPSPASCSARMSSLARSARRECTRSHSASGTPSLAARARNATPASGAAADVGGAAAAAGGASIAGAAARSGAAAASAPERERRASKAESEKAAGASRRSLSSSSSAARLTPSAPRQEQGRPVSNLFGDEERVGRVFERRGDPDIEVPTVLRSLRDAEALRLVRCGITDRWLTQLCHGGSSKWSGVRLLDLRHNLLTASCCAAVAAVVSGGLEALVLDGNRVRAQGLEVICAAVKGSQRCGLRWLSVAENAISHPGGVVVAELLGKEGGCPLQGLCLAKNPQLSCGELSAMFRALCRQVREGEAGHRLEQFDVSACGAGLGVVPHLARAVRQCPGLTVNVSNSGLLEQGRAPPELEDLVAEGRVQL